MVGFWMMVVQVRSWLLDLLMSFDVIETCKWTTDNR